MFAAAERKDTPTNWDVIARRNKTRNCPRSSGVSGPERAAGAGPRRGSRAWPGPRGTAGPFAPRGPGERSATAGQCGRRQSRRRYAVGC